MIETMKKVRSRYISITGEGHKCDSYVLIVPTIYRHQNIMRSRPHAEVLLYFYTRRSTLSPSIKMHVLRDRGEETIFGIKRQNAVYTSLTSALLYIHLETSRRQGSPPLLREAGVNMANSGNLYRRSRYLIISGGCSDYLLLSSRPSLP